MPPALKRLRARPRKAPKMSDKQPELCQVGDRESGRLCRLPSSRLPSWGAAASTLKPWELGTQSRPEVLHWAASGLWFRISAQGGPGPGGLRCCCPGLGRRLGCPRLSASGVWAQHAPSLPGPSLAGRRRGEGEAAARRAHAADEQPRRVWKAYRPKEDVGGNFRPEKEENPGWLYFVASQHRGGGSGPGRGAAPLTRPSF